MVTTTGNMPGRSRIYVCQSGTCRSRGSDAALVEIEELAKLVGDCDVGSTGCLGYCRRGPAVMVAHGKKRRYHVRVNTLEKSADVVRHATGRDPPVDNLPPATEARLDVIRTTKQREYFVATYQWNKALAGLSEESMRQANVRRSVEDVLRRAGYPDARPRDLLVPSSSPLAMPASIENYVPWNLDSVKIVSGHSAIFSFSTKDLKRGTPHPRGRARMAEPVTWHVTMLGEVGPNGEGPLPWIERDYTPISSALEWERGRCDILAKIYNDGLVTKWLQWRGNEGGDGGTRIWLSKPLRTLSVPALITDDDDGFRPRSVLLLLAGTGIVALPQILAHREPHRFLGVSTPRYKQLHCPIDLVHSCREDDVLLLPEIKQYCLDGLQPHPRNRGLRNYTLLLTEERNGEGERGGPPYREYASENRTVDCCDFLKDVSNATVQKSRLNGRIVEDAVAKWVYPCRVIVSGPDAFNNAAREYLEECGVESKSITILSA